MFAECKWKDKVDAAKVLNDLFEKAQHVEWERKKEHFAVFAKSFKRRIDEFEGRRAFCFDLKDISGIQR